MKLWAQTEETVAGLMVAPPDDAKVHRKVASVLSESFGERDHIRRAVR
ncbi:MAG: hypothetical protein IPL61_39145 [Myxococcales bacterium]|nr:hypothetical protein [Myxococcales bacterium]